jgi:AcrR family transcriptional regulator
MAVGAPFKRLKTLEAVHFRNHDKTLETFFVFIVSKVYFVYICSMNDELSIILQRVHLLYRKYGIRSVTMDDVSRELGISKKTLYQYVKDKDELVRKVVELDMTSQHDHMFESFKENLNAIEELTEIARCISFMLKEYSAVTEYDLKKYYPDLYIRIRELRRESMFRFIQDNLIKGKREGLYRKDLDVEILTKLVVSHIDSMFESEVITLSEFLEQHVFFEYFVYHLRGIVNENGLRILEDQLQKLNIEKNKS